MARILQSIIETYAENDSQVDFHSVRARLDDYIGYLREAGFEDVEVVESRKAVESLPEDDPIVRSVLEGTGAASYDDLASEIRGVAGRVLSAKITARKP